MTEIFGLVHKEVLKEWDTWFSKLGSSVVDGGNPVTPSAKTISKEGKISNGSGGPMPSGYSILKATSLDEAVGMVFETFNAM